MNSEVRTVRFAPGVRVLRRDESTIQFGVDATRSGAINVPADQALAVFERAHDPIDVEDLVSSCADLDGMTPTSARELIDDLVAYRILVPAVSHRVLLLGRSALAGQIASALQALGISVRMPVSGETIAGFLDRTDSDAPILIVDQLADTPQISRMLTFHTGWRIPVATVDARVRVGPLSYGPHGPCPMCAHLADTAHDEQWHNISVSAAATPARLDPSVVLSGAMLATVITRRILGIPDPPGVAAPAPVPGHVFTADPFGMPMVTQRLDHPHPLCPVCFLRHSPTAQTETDQTDTAQTETDHSRNGARTARTSSP